jgi:hypothetical protein
LFQTTADKTSLQQYNEEPAEQIVVVRVRADHRSINHTHKKVHKHVSCNRRCIYNAANCKEKNADHKSNPFTIYPYIYADNKIKLQKQQTQINKGTASSKCKKKGDNRQKMLLKLGQQASKGLLKGRKIQFKPSRICWST